MKKERKKESGKEEEEEEAMLEKTRKEENKPCHRNEKGIKPIIVQNKIFCPVSLRNNQQRTLQIWNEERRSFESAHTNLTD